MTLLEQLEKDLPARMRDGHLDQLGLIVKDLSEDIGKAREGGYSWEQIRRAMKEILSERGEWDEDWKATQIERRYKKVREQEALAS